MLQAGFEYLAIAILDGARTHALLVNGLFTAPGFNTIEVNKSARHLFPAICLFNNRFIRRETRRVAPYVRCQQAAVTN